ncbi:allophanate hydrolase subunit 1 [Actinoallomurus sp. NPDC050550]|uniref:5-oxoprolinase subunit B family protein n=1 Tax=Actinoallomurus sp. NPDC050550 TaxID=3154937 RepID=UPI0033F59264
MDDGILIADCGDSAVVVKATGADDHAWQVVHALADAIEASRPDGVYGIVPAYDSLLVEFDCSATDHGTVQRAVRGAAGRLAGRPVSSPSPRRFTVPVVYGGEYGPDLPVVARQLGLTEREVVELHTAQDLTVRCLGAPVGAPMMDGPTFPRPVPRLASPRTSVPPGSVAVAGRQAVICPMRSPGGWPLLGRTPLRVLDLDAEPPAPYRPGDTFRFVPITAEEWHEHDGAMPAAEAVDRG